MAFHIELQAIIFFTSVILLVKGIPSPQYPDQPLVDIPQHPAPQSRPQEISSNGSSGASPCSGLLKNPSRSGLTDRDWRWKSFNIYIDHSYDESDHAIIMDGFTTLSKAVPCLPFGIWPEGSSPSGDYVHIKNGTGCTSYLGRIGGKQELILGKSSGCMTTTMVMHELMHALGVIHEHQRPDRDDFVRILWENIQQGADIAYYKYSPNDVSSFGIQYNTRSIMHYSSRAFSKNNESTMLTSYGQKLEWPFHLQQSDVDKLRKMYEC